MNTKTPESADIHFTAKVRLHFNRHTAAPLVWCVATDDFEIAVRGFVVQGALVETVYSPKETPDDEDGKPTAWLSTIGQAKIRIRDGWAYIDTAAV